MVAHQDGLAGGASYTVTTPVQVPADLSGPYYLFVITDPPTDSPIGQVFEGGGANEDNNSLYLAPPLVIDPPPPSQLVVTSITLPDPATVKSGDPFTVSWTVDGRRAPPTPRREAGRTRSTSAPELPGDIADVYLGTVQHTGTLAARRKLHRHARRPTCRRCRRGSTTSSSAPTSSTRSQLPAGVPSLEQDHGLGRPARRWRSTA